jgi:hypothetical protein
MCLGFAFFSLFFFLSLSQGLLAAIDGGRIPPFADAQLEQTNCAFYDGTIVESILNLVFSVCVCVCFL